MRDKRYDFWGRRKPYKIPERKPEHIEDDEEEHEHRGFNLSFLWIAILLGGLLFFAMFLIPMFNILDNPVSIDGTYTIEIYVPDCDGRLIYREEGVSGQMLYNRELATQQGILDDSLIPVSNYRRWEQYVSSKTGNGIPEDNCCVILQKEST